MTDLRQAAQQALEALEGWDNYGAWVWPESALEQSKQNTTDSIAALRKALEQPEQEQMRMPKVGDKVICLEDESLGEVVSLTAGGSPDITFDDGSRGTYMLREFAELFGYVTPPAAEPEQEPVAYYHPHKGFYWAKPTHISAPAVVDVPPVPLYVKWIAAQRPWVGLDEDDIRKLYGKDLNYRDGNYVRYAMAVEAKLKERNT